MYNRPVAGRQHAVPRRRWSGYGTSPALGARVRVGAGGRAPSSAESASAHLGRNHESPSLARSPEDGLHNVYEFLFVLEGPVDFVVVSGAQIDHYVLYDAIERGHANKTKHKAGLRAPLRRQGIRRPVSRSPRGPCVRGRALPMIHPCEEHALASSSTHLIPEEEHDRAWIVQLVCGCARKLVRCRRQFRRMHQ